MAIISKIRNNSWVLVILIGIGLAGFLLMDMFSGDTSVFGSTSTSVGEIDGYSIEIADLNRRENIYNFIYGGQGNSYDTKEFLWNHMVEERIMKEKASALGMGVSKEELMELQFGQNLSSIIQSRFSDPQTRQINRENLNQVKQAIDAGQLGGDYRQYWAYQETEIIKKQLQDKYTRLVSQVANTPKWIADFNNVLGNKMKTVVSTKVAFDLSDYSGVATDDEINGYLKNNKAKYFSKVEKRQVSVLNMTVLPTKKDSLALYNKINGLVAQLKSSENLELFVEQNEGIADASYFLKSELAPGSADSIFNTSVGNVYGPFMDNGIYQIVRVVDRMTIADSVKARHILIQSAGNIAQANSTADSLKNLIETGVHSFDSLAVAFGTDATAAKGGDLGYAARGAMVKEFNDLIFYEAKVGTVYTVTTQFGVHVVEVTDRKYGENKEAIKLAILTERIVPSEETQDAIYEKAQLIMRDNRTVDQLKAYVASDPSFILSESELFDANSYQIKSFNDPSISRDAVKWAFNTNTTLGSVNDEVYTKQNNVGYFNSNYFIIALGSIVEPGLPSAEELRFQIEPILLNEKRGESIAAAVKGMDLNAVASKYNTTVDTLTRVSISSPFIPNIGNEPKVVGKISSLANGASGVIVGNSGVFAVQVIEENQSATTPSSYQQQRKASLGSAIRNNLFKEIRDNMDVVDNRFDFF